MPFFRVCKPTRIVFDESEDINQDKLGQLRTFDGRMTSLITPTFAGIKRWLSKLL
jgi:hypothetical protein